MLPSAPYGTLIVTYGGRYFLLPVSRPLRELGDEPKLYPRSKES